MYEARPWLAHNGAVPATLDYPDSSIFGLLEADLRKHPRLPALVFMGRTTTKARLLERITLMSRAFAAQGMEAGDRVIICLPNMPQAVIAFYRLPKATIEDRFRLTGDEGLAQMFVGEVTQGLPGGGFQK